MERRPRSRRGAVGCRLVGLNRQRAVPAPAGAKHLPCGGQVLTGHAQACRSDCGGAVRGRPDGACHWLVFYVALCDGCDAPISFRASSIISLGLKGSHLILSPKAVYLSAWLEWSGESALIITFSSLLNTTPTASQLAINAERLWRRSILFQSESELPDLYNADLSNISTA